MKTFFRFQANNTQNPLQLLQGVLFGNFALMLIIRQEIRRHRKRYRHRRTAIPRSYPF